MEVTTVSPSPVSPTEGDHLCETDVTTVATHSVTLLICLCGLAGNGAVIGLLGLKGDKFIIQNLAVIDFLILLLTFPSALLFLVEDVSCSPILPLVYLRFLFRLSVVSCYWGPFWVTSFSIEVGIEMLLELCYRRDLPEGLFFLVRSVQFWAFSALLSEAPTVTLLCPANEQEHCRAAHIAVWAIILLLFVVPMTVLVIYSTIALIKARCGSQQKQPKGRDIVIVFSGPFTILFLLWNFLQELGYLVVPSHFFFLLTCIYSSIKPFIYFLAGRCWSSCSVESLQLSLQRVFEELE